MVTTMKIEKFREMYFSAKPEKIKILQEYCAERNLLLEIVVENIPEKKLKEFEAFLVDNDILEDK
jgi:hypothetical protein